ncbi:hypothetical protein MRB53_012668 [Persea americana]|uniref:Uncharacterized protein n=1 Tax=Persea americana TaxID=3435 RepID=A0ACC2LYF1_PERAE|nr:hypothetical protein MRB53_012668 [Persea americana]
MNYWPSLPCNLSECQEPLFDYISSLAINGSKTARAQDFEDPDAHHRHLSHLFGLFPGHTITLEKTPDLSKAADYTLYKRAIHVCFKSGVQATSVQNILKLNNFVRKGVKEEIELNFTSAIAEMLVQSTEKDLYILPALPRDKWANGCVKGLKARGGVTVNICWKEGGLHEVCLWTRANKKSMIRLHYDGTVASARLLAGNIYTFDRKLKCLKMHFL